MNIKQLIYESTRYIHAHYTDNLTVAGIAAKMYLSTSYFAASFRLYTGYTVKAYLNAVRLYRAAEMLRDSSAPIADVAYETGFSSQQALTRSFSQLYGIAPQKFRANRPALEPFPNPNIWQEVIMNEEYQAIFNNVRIEHKEELCVVGIECNIHYNSGEGTAPIGGLWDKWFSANYLEQIKNRIDATVLGITYGESADGAAKYLIGAAVASSDDVPPDMVCRTFPASGYAVFSATLEQIWTGNVWRTFYHHWLPQSGYTMPDKQLREHFPTATEYPGIELYDEQFCGPESLVHLYAPVRKA
jgi:AraC-like DNA-binding protein/predicted transcriptional regulator YdeE